MTERGTRARWTAAALVAPAAAAVFTGTTVWAAEHQPVTATTATKPVATAPAVDPAVEELKADVAAAQKQVAQLRSQVKKLAKQAAAIKAGKVATGTSSKSGTSSSTSSKKSTTSSKKSTTTSKPAPAPAPTSHTTTGASG